MNKQERKLLNKCFRIIVGSVIEDMPNRIKVDHSINDQDIEDICDFMRKYKI